MEEEFDEKQDVDEKSIKLMLKYLDEYEKVMGSLTSNEYLAKKFSKDCLPNKLQKCAIYLFREYDKFSKVIEFVAEEFAAYMKLRKPNKRTLHLHVFLVMNVLEEDNIKAISGVFQTLDCKYKFDLIHYFTQEENLIKIAQKSCTIFSNDYVLNNIIAPLVDKSYVITNLGMELQYATVIKYQQKNLTVPKSPEVLHNAIKRTPAPPKNTPKDLTVFRAQTIPLTTYNPEQDEQILSKIRENNYKIAMNLLRRANKMSERLTNPKKYPAITEPVMPPQFKANKIPATKNIHVEVKGNLTTTFRQAQKVFRDHENEVKRIEEIICSGCDPEKIRNMENENRKQEEIKLLQDIEKRHLEGMLTYEEAILAKKKAMQKNREKAQLAKAEQLRLKQEFEKWKQEEETKIKTIVDSIKELENKNIKESEKRTVEKKQENARLLKYETKQMLKEAYDREREELDKKMQLIEEIRKLDEFNRVLRQQIKEFDPTETPNYGLLGEMSIAELQERLVLMKDQTKMELDSKRKNILKRKEEQQKMLENLKNFIMQNQRMSKRKSMPAAKCISREKLEQSPDLIVLRKRLEEKRNERKNIL